jgi:hypothetical protein
VSICFLGISEFNLGVPDIDWLIDGQDGDKMMMTMTMTMTKTMTMTMMIMMISMGLWMD